MPKIVKDCTVTSEQGMHARPAAIFVQIAIKYNSQLTVKKGNESVNGKSIMGLLMLGIERNSTITLTAEGDDAEVLINELEEFLKKDE